MSSDAAVKMPLLQRLNFRMIGFAAVVLLLIGYPLYQYVESEITGGIKSAGGGYVQVDLKAMSSFPFDQINGANEDIPAKWRDLSGRKVILYGEIAPTTFATGSLNEFDLVYSVQKCCFSGPPQIQHFVQSRMLDGSQVPYYSGLVKVKGTLRVGVKQGEGRVGSIYRLDVESLEPVM